MDPQYIMNASAYEFVIDELLIQIDVSLYPRNIFGELPICQYKNTSNRMIEYLFIRHKNDNFYVDWPKQVYWTEIDIHIEDKTKEKINSIVSKFFKNSAFW